MLFDDSMHDGQAEASAFSGFLGAKEGVEYVGECFFCNPGPIIRNSDQYIASRGFPPLGFALCLIHFKFPGFNHQAAALRHGVPCIDTQIHQNLLDHPRVTVNRPEAIAGYHPQFQFSPKQPVHQLH